MSEAQIQLLQLTTALEGFRSTIESLKIGFQSMAQLIGTGVKAQITAMIGSMKIFATMMQKIAYELNKSIQGKMGIIPGAGGYKSALEGINLSAKGQMTKGSPDLSGIEDALKSLENIGNDKGGDKTALTPLKSAEDAFSTFFSDIGTNVKSIGSGIKEAFGGIVGNLKGDLGGFDQAKGGSQKAFGGLKGIAQSFGKLSPKIFSSMGGMLASMGPQMAALAIVMKPVQALLEGLLEPFSILSDTFGQYGEILGQMFLPVILIVNDMLIAFLPIISALAEVMGPLVQLFMMFGTTMGIWMVLMPVIEPYIGLIANALSNFANILNGTLGGALSFITGVIEAWVSIFLGVFEWANEAINTIGELGTTIRNFFIDIKDGFVGWTDDVKEFFGVD